MYSGHVIIVDDDHDVRNGLSRLLAVVGHSVQSYASAEAFLAARNWRRPACLLLDIHMNGMNGLRLQEKLAQDEHPLPIIFLTGHGNVPISVQAMKAGATDFLLKPFDPEALLQSVSTALEADASALALHNESRLFEEMYAKLTSREREIFAHLLSGSLNKQIADAIGIAEKTVKYHRANLMRKLGVSSIAEIVQIAAKLGIEPIRPSAPLYDFEI